MINRYTNEKPLYVLVCNFNGKLPNGMVETDLPRVPELKLADFPEITDFIVSSEGDFTYPSGRKDHEYCDGIRFKKKSGEYLAMCVLERRSGSMIKDLDFTDIPMGNRNTNSNDWYSDLDQGYCIIIFDEDDYVYVLYCWSEDEYYFNKFETWFKVKKQRYISQWATLIKKYKNI